MDYKNKFYKMLERMSNSCINCNCDSCIFCMEDKCVIRDLFQELSYVDPWKYGEVYIEWFNNWEVIYNELHS